MVAEADSPVLGHALSKLFGELLEGPPDRGGYMLNAGDPGLLRSLDEISWDRAARGPDQGGASIAQHVDHLRYGISLMNRWAGGEQNPFKGADWGASWKTTVADASEWKALRDALGREVHRWRETLASAGESEPVDGVTLRGMIGSIAHLAYHVGAIRQIDRATRGPTDEESRARLAKPGGDAS